MEPPRRAWEHAILAVSCLPSCRGVALLMPIFGSTHGSRPPWTARCARFLALLAACLLGASLTGCAQILGIEDLPELQPSNGALAEHLEGVSAELLVPSSANAVLHTDTGELVLLEGGEEVRGPGEGVIDGIGFFILEDGIAVLAVSALTLESDATLAAYGELPLILLSAGDVWIEGRIDFSAPCDGVTNACPAPGGGAGAVMQSGRATGCAPGEDGAGKTGGGGGGFLTDGAEGGADDEADVSGGAGGVLASDECPDAWLDYLTGGSGGGAGGAELSGGDGGGGGGAVQITSFTRIDIMGDPASAPDALDVVATSYIPTTGIFANGAGGKAGGSGGGGGGAGGAILLEAPVLEIRNAYVTANGGGGGAGGGASVPAADGENGHTDGNPAIGGAGDFPGGNGGTGALAPTPGAGGLFGGGGGGSAGIIHLHVAEPELVIESSIVSPEPTYSDPSWN
jgi:hypothetical protein